jgi:hypothetical protein
MVREAGFVRPYPTAKKIDLGLQTEHYTSISEKIHLRCALRERTPWS